MSRYIDADKLKKHYAWWQGGTLEKTLDEMKRDFDTIIDLQPTVEPKHGRWIGIDDFPHETWECDRCGKIIETDEPPNYCENCGARMMDTVEE